MIFIRNFVLNNLFYTKYFTKELMLIMEFSKEIKVLYPVPKRNKDFVNFAFKALKIVSTKDGSIHDSLLVTFSTLK